jgi:hypothetical protein
VARITVNAARAVHSSYSSPFFSQFSSPFSSFYSSFYSSFFVCDGFDDSCYNVGA